MGDHADFDAAVVHGETGPAGGKLSHANNISRFEVFNGATQGAITDLQQGPSFGDANLIRGAVAAAFLN